MGTVAKEVSQILPLSRPLCFPLGKSGQDLPKLLLSPLPKRWKLKETLKEIEVSHSWKEISVYAE